MQNPSVCPLDNPPKIEFPCEYPIKVMGPAAPDFKACILDTLIETKTSFIQETVAVVDSKNGRYQSIRVTIQAKSADHLFSLHQCLKDTGRVQLVL